MEHSNSNSTLTNVIMWGNTASSSAEISHSDGTLTVTYSNIQGGYPGTGNINANPLFVDADGPDNIVGTLDDNLRLQSGSPSIDTGNNAAVPTGVTTDLEGKPRIQNGTVDMGAYEYDTPPTVVSITRADPNPTSAASVNFIVTFTEAVTGVGVADFALTLTGGISGASVTGVSGSGAVYTVTVSTGTGDGTLRLDIPNTATITDLAGNALSGLPFTGGETYQKGYRVALPLIVR